MTKRTAIVGLLALGACAAEQDFAEQDSPDPQAIIGGSEATPNSQPWLVALRWDGDIQCAGVLLSDRWVLTAAHCFKKASYEDMTAIIGEHSTRRWESFEQRRALRKPEIHRGYTGDRDSKDDIALVQLRSPVEINEQAQTIALPTSFIDIYDIVGWGLVGTAPEIALTTLQTASVVQLPNEACTSGTVGDNEFCAGSGDPSIVTDSCIGDSGGPALNPTVGPRQETVGIVSRGDGFCTGAGIYTRVDRYLDWIRQTIGTSLVGQARMSWSGEESPGFMELTCDSTGERVRGPLNVRGVEISLDCPDSVVTGRCQVDSWQHRIADLYYGTNGSLEVADGNDFLRTGRLYFPGGSTGSFNCRVEGQ